MSKTFPKVYLECFAHISADSQPFWLKIGPFEKSRVSGPLPVPVPAVTRTPNPQGLQNPCHSLPTDFLWILLEGGLDSSAFFFPFRSALDPFCFCSSHFSKSLSP